MSPAGSIPLCMVQSILDGQAEQPEPLPPHDFATGDRTCKFCHLPQEAVDDGFIDNGCRKRDEWIKTYGEPA